MDKNLDNATFAVSLIFKAVIIAAQYSGRNRRRSLKRLAAMDIDEKDKENLFLKGQGLPARNSGLHPSETC